MSQQEVAAGRLSRLAVRVRSVAAVGKRGGRPAPLVEMAGLLLVMLVFTRLHLAAGKDIAAGTANAMTLQSLERVLNLDIALAANQWLVGNPGLIQPAVYYYRLYYLAIVGVLVWVYVRHAEVYIKVRRTIVTMLGLVLIVYWAVPMAPPWMALPGIVDILAEHDFLGGYASREFGGGQNLISAMPSMHVGWSLWCAYAAWCALRVTRPRAAWLVWIFPLGMAAVVLVTGNHYVLDIVGSVVLLTVSIAVVSVWSRFRDEPETRTGPQT